jgi:DNA polymerase/3'-5' exonuclease PolX
MSTGKMRRERALRLASMVVRMIQPYCERVFFAGSIRRGKAVVGDAEVVFIPRDIGALWARLDVLVGRGQLARAVYLDKNGRTSHKWGKKYRGVSLPHAMGFKVELFAADEHNLGYQLWLRTGPGDANTVIMQELKHRNSPMRFEGGYMRYEGVPISTPSERVFFVGLGLPYLPASQRTADVYRKMYGGGSWVLMPPSWYHQRAIRTGQKRLI